jgi:hypothetical protein
MPCSPLEVNGLYLLPAFLLVSFFAYSSTLQMEATCSSELSVDVQRTTQCYIPEHRTLHNHCRENLEYYVIMLVSCWHVPFH